jgi:3-dehydroquinate synthetase
MEIAAQFSLEKGFMTSRENERIVNLLRDYGLLNEYKIPSGKMEELILHDKKKTGKDLHFVFAEGIGKAVIRKIPVDEVIDFYEHFKKEK